MIRRQGISREGRSMITEMENETPETQVEIPPHTTMVVYLHHMTGTIVKTNMAARTDLLAEIDATAEIDTTIEATAEIDTTIEATAEIDTIIEAITEITTTTIEGTIVKTDTQMIEIKAAVENDTIKTSKALTEFEIIAESGMAGKIDTTVVTVTEILVENVAKINTNQKGIPAKTAMENIRETAQKRQKIVGKIATLKTKMSQKTKNLSFCQGSTNESQAKTGPRSKFNKSQKSKFTTKRTRQCKTEKKR